MSDLKLGGIYITKWDKRPFRIIGIDEIEVFYDCLWPHNNSWSFSGKFNERCSFYRLPRQLFTENSTLRDFINFTEEEKHFFRPDLLMRIARLKIVSWNQFKQSNYREFRFFLNATIGQDIPEQTLTTDSIYVYPFGPKGGARRSKKLVADNKKYFTIPELIWKCKSIQETVNPNISKGVGVYRSGIERGIPLYYIGEYFDEAKYLTE